MFNLLERHKIMMVYVPLIFYWILLFTLTSLPSQSIPAIGISDKIEHLLAYFGLSFLLYLTFLFQKKSLFFKKYALILTVVIVFFYGILDEVHQLLIPGRSCELMDFTADIIGGILGVIVIKILVRYYKFKESTAT